MVQQMFFSLFFFNYSNGVIYKSLSCIIKKGTEKHVLDNLNSVRSSIKFNKISEKDSKPHFLDSLLKRESVIVCLLPQCAGNLHTQIDTFT